MIGDCESSLEGEASKEKEGVEGKKRKKTAAREQKEGVIEIRLAINFACRGFEEKNLGLFSAA